MKLVIQSNLYRYLGILLEAREFFEESLCGNKNGRHVDESTSSGKCFFFLLGYKVNHEACICLKMKYLDWQHFLFIYLYITYTLK